VNHKQFAKTLHGWRVQSGYTQQEAADRLGVSRRSLENWEQERARPQGFGFAAMLRIIGGPKAKKKAKPPRRK
jgi:DNA-binding transcriptional regulator YiaG